MSDAPSDRDRLQRLFDGIGEMSLESRGLADDILADAGYSREQLAVEGAALARQLYGEARLRTAAAERVSAERRAGELREKVEARLKAAGENALEVLARLLAGAQGTTVQAQFRKLSDLGPEDALDMLTEAELLRLLDEPESDRPESEGDDAL